jgi:hypothetical protein
MGDVEPICGKGKANCLFALGRRMYKESRSKDHSRCLFETPNMAKSEERIRAASERALAEDLTRRADEFLEHSLNAIHCVNAYFKSVDLKYDKMQFLLGKLHNVQLMPSEFAHQLSRLRMTISREITRHGNELEWFRKHDMLLTRATHIKNAGEWLYGRIKAGDDGLLINSGARKLRHRMDCAKISIDVAGYLKSNRLARWDRIIRACETVLGNGRAITHAALY